MENLTSQPQLQLPKIPRGWCPSGATLSEKFQAYQDEILSQAIINIPGLEQINLLDLISIQAQLTALTNNYAALNKAERSVIGVALITNGVVSVNLVPNMPSDDYNVMPIIVSPSGSSAAAAHFEITLVDGTKDATGFDILCSNIPADYTADFFVRQR